MTMFLPEEGLPRSACGLPMVIVAVARGPEASKPNRRQLRWLPPYPYGHTHHGAPSGMQSPGARWSLGAECVVGHFRDFLRLVSLGLSLDPSVEALLQAAEILDFQ